MTSVILYTSLLVLLNMWKKLWLTESPSSFVSLWYSKIWHLLSGFFFLLLSCFCLSLSNLVSTVPIWLSVDSTSNSISSVERCPSQLQKIVSRVHTGYTAVAPSDLAILTDYWPAQTPPTSSCCSQSRPFHYQWTERSWLSCYFSFKGPTVVLLSLLFFHVDANTFLDVMSMDDYSPSALLLGFVEHSPSFA